MSGVRFIVFSTSSARDSSSDIVGEYTYVERGTRACVLEGNATIWWGQAGRPIPVGVVPLDVLLTLSILRFLWKS
jgi:hypothetical protein